MTRSARRSFHSFLRGILFLLACTYATSAQTARQQITIVRIIFQRKLNRIRERQFQLPMLHKLLKTLRQWKHAATSRRRLLDIAADVDPNIRALDLNLTEKPEPSDELLTVDIATELKKALINHPEVEAQRLQLENDDMNVRIAHNGLKPQLNLSALYSGSGLNTTTAGPFLEALDQSFGFSQPTYGGSLSLNLPIRNYAAKATVAAAQINKRHDLYSERQLQQQITLEVATAVHQLEQSKLSMEAAKIALNLAQKNLQAEQRKYELGAETLFVVLETQSELAQVEQSVIQSQVSYQLAVASVYHATGELLGNYNVKIAGS